jgi:hypothetical protein
MAGSFFVSSDVGEVDIMNFILEFSIKNHILFCNIMQKQGLTMIFFFGNS